MAISGRPSEASKGGGQYDDIVGKVEVIGCQYIVDQYEPNKTTGEQAPPFCGIEFELQPLDDDWEPDNSVDPGKNVYKVGDASKFQPAEAGDDEFDNDADPDEMVGETGPWCISAGNAEPNENSKFTRLMALMVKKGFREKEITGNAEVFIGTKMELEQKRYEGSEKQFSYSMPVPLKIEALPYESGGKSGGGSRRSRRGKSGDSGSTERTSRRSRRTKDDGGEETTSTRRRSRRSKKNEPEEPNEDLKTTAVGILKKLIARKKRKNIEEVTIQQLATDVLGVAMGMSDLTKQEQKAVSALVKDEDFMENVGEELGFELDGEDVLIGE